DPLVAFKACSDLGLPTDWVGLANRVELRRGRKPGKSFVLLTYKTLKDIGIADLSQQGLDNDSKSFSFRITCVPDQNGPKDQFTLPTAESVNAGNQGGFNPEFKPYSALGFSRWIFVQAVAIVMADAQNDAIATPGSGSPGGGNNNLPVAVGHPN